MQGPQASVSKQGGCSGQANLPAPAARRQGFHAEATQPAHALQEEESDEADESMDDDSESGEGEATQQQGILSQTELLEEQY